MRETTTPVEPKVRRGKARQPANRLLERDQLLVTNIVTKDAGEGSVRARMRIRFEEHTLGRGGGLVRAKAHPVERDFAAQVVLRRDEVARPHAALILDHEIHRGLFRRSPAHLRDLGQRPSGKWLQRVALEGDEEHSLRPAGGKVEVLPVRSRRAHFACEPLAKALVAKARDPRAESAFLDPRWHGRVEAGRAGRVRVHVRGDLEAGVLRLLDALDDGGELRPVRPAGLL